MRFVLWRDDVLRGAVRAVQTLNTDALTPGGCCRPPRKKWVRPSGFDTGLKTFNSLTKQKEPLILAREGIATWYEQHFFP